MVRFHDGVLASFAVKVLVDAHLRAKQEGRARLPLTALLSSFAGAVRWLQPNGRGFESLRALPVQQVPVSLVVQVAWFSTRRREFESRRGRSFARVV